MPAFPPFRPDLGELSSGTPFNVLMTGNGYGPRPTLAIAPGAASLPAAPRGAFGGILPNGTFKAFAATATKVYTMGATYTFTALSPTFTVPATDDEAMCQFGVFMIASNTTDGMYAYNMDTPAGLNAISGAPKARYMFATNNMLVALGDGGSLLNRLATTAFGDQTNWTTKGASKQDMNDGGAFTGGGDVGNTVAVLLQQTAVRKMTFGNAGGGALFRLDVLASDVGCVHPRAQITYNGVIYFLHTDGIYACDGINPPVNIGADQVNLWFFARCPDLTKVYFSVDPKHTLIRIRYKATGVASDTVFLDILDYNWVTKKFVPGTETTSAIFRMGTPGYVLNDLDTFGALNAWSAYPLDSAFWQGGTRNLAGLTSDFKFGFFNGASAAASIETNTMGDGTSYMVNRCEPLTDDSAATVQLGVKDRITDNFDWKTPAPIAASGRAALRGRGKYQRLRVNHLAGAPDWAAADLGIEGIDQVGGGPR